MQIKCYTHDIENHTLIHITSSLLLDRRVKEKKTTTEHTDGLNNCLEGNYSQSSQKPLVLRFPLVRLCDAPRGYDQVAMHCQKLVTKLSPLAW